MSDRTSGNYILEAVPAETLRSLDLEEFDSEIGESLYTPDEAPRFVYFPHRGAVVSVVRSTEDGAMVEAGLVGAEGLLSVHAAIDDPRPTGSEAIVQLAGRLSRVDAQRLRERFREDAALRDAVLVYTSYFLTQVTQNLVCNRLHDIERRLSKWLLFVRDRAESDEMSLTQEFLRVLRRAAHEPRATPLLAATLKTSEPRRTYGTLLTLDASA